MQLLFLHAFWQTLYNWAAGLQSSIFHLVSVWAQEKAFTAEKSRRQEKVLIMNGFWACRGAVNGSWAAAWRTRPDPLAFICHCFRKSLPLRQRRPFRFILLNCNVERCSVWWFMIKCGLFCQASSGVRFTSIIKKCHKSSTALKL